MLVQTPVALDHLSDEMAIFTGSAREQVERNSLMGTISTEFRFPCIQLSRQHWEDLGCPVSLVLSLDEIPVHDET